MQVKTRTELCTQEAKVLPRKAPVYGAARDIGQRRAVDLLEQILNEEERTDQE